MRQTVGQTDRRRFVAIISTKCGYTHQRRLQQIHMYIFTSSNNNARQNYGKINKPLMPQNVAAQQIVILNFNFLPTIKEIK